MAAVLLVKRVGISLKTQKSLSYVKSARQLLSAKVKWKSIQNLEIGDRQTQVKYSWPALMIKFVSEEMQIILKANA